MKYFPNKIQWQKWSMPSKYTAIGLFLTIISFVLMLIFEWNPFKEIISVDNMKKARTHLQLAQKNYIDQNFDRMLSNAKIAYELDETPASIEFFAFALLKNMKTDSCYILLTDHEPELNDSGKWLFGLSLALKEEYKKALKIFKSLSIDEIPIKYRIDGLNAFLTSAANVSKEELRFCSQNIIQYISKQIKFSSNGGKVELLTNGKATFKFELNSVIFLPAFYFRVGSLLLYTENDSLSEKAFSIALNYIQKGFSSSLISFPSSQHLAFFNFLDSLSMKRNMSIEGQKLFCSTIESVKEDLNRALNNKVNVCEINLSYDFNSEDYKNLRNCVNITNRILGEE